MKQKLIVAPILAVLILTSFNGFSQKKKKGEEQLSAPSFPMVDEKVVFSEVVNVSGWSSETLYKNALKWFNSYYKNPTNVIKENVANQKIKGKARFKVYIDDAKTGIKTSSGLMAYTIEVSIKEGKYKYDITKINRKAASYFGIEKMIADNAATYKYAYATYLIQTDEYIKKTVSNLKKAMVFQEKKTEDW